MNVHILAQQKGQLGDEDQDGLALLTEFSTADRSSPKRVRGPSSGFFRVPSD